MAELNGSLTQKAAFVTTLLIAFAFNVPLFAYEGEPNEHADLFEMSIEDLMNVEVVTPSRKPQKIDTAPSNITVITEEEIRD